MSAPERVVVLRASGLGDLLTVVPALRGLRRTWPSARISLATPASLTDLALLTGAVDEVVPCSGLQTALSVDPPVDMAVNLHGSGPQSHRRLLTLRPDRLIGFRHPEVPATDEMPGWDPTEHEVHRWIRLLRSAGVQADPEDLLLDLDLSSRWCGRLRPFVEEQAEPVSTVLHPGAGSPARMWPAERWVELARALDADGHRVVLTGSSSERELAAAIATRAALPSERVLAGTTTVLELVHVVARAGLVICGDTGMGHLATSLRVPTVHLFGPSAPSVWGPPPGWPEQRVLWTGATGDPHGDEPDPGLLRISVADVGDAISELQRPAV